MTAHGPLLLFADFTLVPTMVVDATRPLTGHAYGVFPDSHPSRDRGFGLPSRFLLESAGSTRNLVALSSLL